MAADISAPTRRDPHEGCRLPLNIGFLPLPVDPSQMAMTHPLRSTGITPASSLLQGSPPLSGASVLSASRLEPLAPCMGLCLSRSFGTPAHVLHQFLCSIRKPFLRPDRRFAHVRRAQELSRLAVAPT